MVIVDVRSSFNLEKKANQNLRLNPSSVSSSSAQSSLWWCKTWLWNSDPWRRADGQTRGPGHRLWFRFHYDSDGWEAGRWWRNPDGAGLSCRRRCLWQIVVLRGLRRRELQAVGAGRTERVWEERGGDKPRWPPSRMGALAALVVSGSFLRVWNTDVVSSILSVDWGRPPWLSLKNLQILNRLWSNSLSDYVSGRLVSSCFNIPAVEAPLCVAFKDLCKTGR